MISILDDPDHRTVILIVDACITLQWQPACRPSQIQARLVALHLYWLPRIQPFDSSEGVCVVQELEERFKLELLFCARSEIRVKIAIVMQVRHIVHRMLQFLQLEGREVLVLRDQRHGEKVENKDGWNQYYGLAAEYRVAEKVPELAREQIAHL